MAVTMGYKLYARSGRWYGDFRSTGREANRPDPARPESGQRQTRESRALSPTTSRRSCSEASSPGIVTGRVKRASFGDYAHEHLDTKSRLGKKLSASHLNDLAKRLEVAAEFFGPAKPPRPDRRRRRSALLPAPHRSETTGVATSCRPASQRAYLSALGGHDGAGYERGLHGWEPGTKPHG